MVKPANENIVASFLDVLREEKNALTEVYRKFEEENTVLVQACEILLNMPRSSRVIVSGIGKAGIIAKKVGATMSSTGTAATFLHPVEGMHGDLGFVQKSDCGLLFSYSGETIELIRLGQELERIGCPILAITRSKNSTLGRLASACIEMGEMKEACYMDLAPSSSTTVMLALGDALALAIAKLKGFEKEDFGKNHPGGSLGLKFRKAHEMMRSRDKAVFLQAQTTLLTFVQEVSQAKAGAAVIIDEEGNLLGIFTDGDLRRALLKGASQEDKLLNFASIPCLSIKANDSVSEALKILKRTKTKDLPVVDSDGKKAVGILCLNDIHLF